MNLKIDPILYRWIKILKQDLDIQLVPRREKRRRNSVELILCNNLVTYVSGHLNSLCDAEACGYWVVVRFQPVSKRTFYHNRAVFQLYLTPVHQVKHHRLRMLAVTAQGFTPVTQKTARHRRAVSIVPLTEQNSL